MSSKVIVVANLVIGNDGSTTKNGSSIGLSSPEDRRRFKEIRDDSDAILIGGSTARREPYKKTPVPLFIVSHSQIKLQPKNPLAKQLNQDPVSALSEIAKFLNDRDEIQILVEGGPKLLKILMENRKIDKIFLTINHAATGENQIKIEDLFSNYKMVECHKIESDEFYTYQLAN